MKDNFFSMNRIVIAHSTAIKQLQTEIGQISAHLNPRVKRGLPSDTIANHKGDTTHCMVVTTHSCKVIYDESPKGNVETLSKEKIVVFQSDELAEELNNKALNDDNEPQPKVNVDIAKEKKNINPPSFPQKYLPKINPPFSQRLKKKKNDDKFKNFLLVFKTLSIHLPLIEALLKMPEYAKFMKKLVTKQWSLDFETIEVSHNYSAIMSINLIVKKEDPSAFIIPCAARLF